PVNEPVLTYAMGSEERRLLQQALQAALADQADIPMFIGGREVRTERTVPIRPPHAHKQVLGHFHYGDKSHVQAAIDAALRAKTAWEKLPWEERAAIFLKAADLIAGPYRYKLNAATMLAQSKNAYQAEIDSACEIVDF